MSENNDELILKIAAKAGELGWPAAARAEGADILFPCGTAGAVDAYFAWIDRQMIEKADLEGKGLLNTRLLARTTDAIWHAAGDKSADFSWYTKRAILGSILSATSLYWLSDNTGGEATIAFLDRRLAAIGKFAKFKASLRNRGQKPAAA